MSESFVELKQQLAGSKVLIYFHLDAKTQLIVDASLDDLNAVLL
jgi:hypothetical protein